MKSVSGSVYTWALIIFVGFTPRFAHAAASVDHLSCEHRIDPLGVDVAQPQLSWQIESDQRGYSESAYQILVASSAEALAADHGDRWDSGKVAAKDELSALYRGKALTTGERVYWQVRVWDQAGQASPWSTLASWTDGIKPDDWTAKWISAPEDAAQKKPVFRQLPIVRKAFSIDKPVKRAVAFVCGLGQFELRVNGKKAGDDELNPGWSNYRKTCLYVTFDLTDQLKSGPNALGVLLGNGMYNVPPQKGRYQKFSGSFGMPKLIAQIKIDFADGTSQTIASDSSWKSAEGPITYSGEYGGEDFDARLWPEGWDAAGFDDRQWTAAVTVDGPGGALAGVSRSAPPITVASTFVAKNFTQPKPGIFVYDLGQNAAFLPQITVSGSTGRAITIRPGELLTPQGTVEQSVTGSPMWYTYTLADPEEQTWSARFTYRGCKYLQIEGAVPEGEPNPDNLPVIHSVAGRFITSQSPIVGDFACSNDLFNRTANIIRWAMRSNMQSVITDCPQRERLGWLEQDHLVGPSMMYNFDVQSLMDKICWDMAGAQTSDGLVPDIAPEYTQFGGGFRDSPEWGSASVLIPWQLYQWYGDLGVLRDHYQMMVNYAHYLSSKAQNGVLSYGLGDWYDIGPKRPGVAQLTPRALTATAFYYRDLSLLSQIADLLGHADDAKAFAAQADSVKDSFNQAFYKTEQHTYATGSQTALAIPLVFDMVPPADREAVGKQLVQELRTHNDRLTAGDIGYRYLLRALADTGHSDLIFDMNSRSDRPGYGFILAKGATSLTEGWDGSASQNHFMLGHIMEWFYSDLAGIARDPSAVGYEKIDIHPTPVGNVTWARASYQSVRGKIVSNWKIVAGRFTLDVTIPPGTTAYVRLPSEEINQATESGKPLANATGVSAAGVEKKTITCSIKSGSYHFEIPYSR